MWNRSRLPLVAILVFDVLLVIGIVSLRKEGTYEAAILTAYFVGVIAVIQVALCVVGFIRDKGHWQAYVYLGHLVTSVTIFLVAELGGFR